jgi:hypothetical protein
MSIPNPGSDEAIERGCTCPVLDNAHGAGVPRGGDENGHQKMAWWVNDGCPLHAANSLWILSHEKEK